MLKEAKKIVKVLKKYENQLSDYTIIVKPRLLKVSIFHGNSKQYEEPETDTWEYVKLTGLVFSEVLKSIKSTLRNRYGKI